MSTTLEIQQALANEARRQEYKQKIASLMGSIKSTASAVQILNSVNSDDQIALADAQRALLALEAGAGAGITADFGPKSTVTQMVEKERFAAKAAVVAFVKANPEATLKEAVGAWTAAAIDSHPEFPMPIQDGTVMYNLYKANLLKAGFIREDSWEAYRQWVLVTETNVIEAA